MSRLPNRPRGTSALALIFVLSFLAGSAVLAACNMPGRAKKPTVTGMDPIYTAAAQTVEAQLTQVEKPTTPIGATPAPSNGTPAVTPTLAQPPAPGNTPGRPTPTPPPCDAAKFIGDITVPDGTRLNPGETFVETWRLKNVGTCTWTANYALVFTKGDRMGAPDAVPLPSDVPPGGTVDISVNLKAPAEAGSYRGEWKLRNAANAIFGVETTNDPIWVEIKVALPGGLVYDFLSKAKLAVWTSGAGDDPGSPLTFGGADEDVNGVAKIKDGVLLETGAYSAKLLLTFPKHADDGFISGLFPAYQVQSGDHIKANLGFMKNSDGSCGVGKVRFEVGYQDGSQSALLGQWKDTCDGRLINIDIDLSRLVGRTVQFFLIVRAEGPSQDDWAVWNSLRIVR